MSADQPRRRATLIVLTVTLALLLAGLGGVGALYLTGQQSAERTRVANVETLKQARGELAEKTKALVDVAADRDEGRRYYENETALAELDRECIEQVRAFLNDLKRNVQAPTTFVPTCSEVPARRSG